MKNKLEDIINNHRDLFDEELPGDHVWNEIVRKRNNRTGMIYRLSISQIAASVILMLSGIAVILLMQVKTEKKAQLPVTVSVSNEIVDDPYEYDIQHMSHVIEIKATELKALRKTDPLLYKNFQGALDQLNASYANLQNESRTNPNKEQLLQAMIQNLKLQQELLNQQLSIYQNLKHSKNEKYSKNI